MLLSPRGVLGYPLSDTPVYHIGVVVLLGTINDCVNFERSCRKRAKKKLVAIGANFIASVVAEVSEELARQPLLLQVHRDVSRPLSDEQLRRDDQCVPPLDIRVRFDVDRSDLRAKLESDRARLVRRLVR